VRKEREKLGRKPGGREGYARWVLTGVKIYSQVQIEGPKGKLVILYERRVAAHKLAPNS